MPYLLDMFPDMSGILSLQDAFPKKKCIKILYVIAN